MGRASDQSDVEEGITASVVGYEKNESQPQHEGRTPMEVEEGRDDHDDDGGKKDGAVKGQLKRIKNSTAAEKAATATAVGAVATSVAAMVMEGNPLIYTAGGLSATIAPYSVYQQKKLTDIAALKETHEKLKNEVDRLSNQNVRLKASVSELSDTVSRLEDVEQALDLITNTQHMSVQAFAEQVQDNKSVLQQLQKNLRANVLQNLLSVIIRSDVDGDFNIDEDEVDSLMKRLQSINGVQLHEDRFRAAIAKSGGGLNDVISVVKSLLRDDVPEGEAIFVIQDVNPTSSQSQQQQQSVP